MRKVGDMIVEEFEDRVPLELREQMNRSLTYRRYCKERNKLAKMARELLRQDKPLSGAEINAQCKLVLSYAQATLEDLGLR